MKKNVKQQLNKLGVEFDRNKLRSNSVGGIGALNQQQMNELI